MLIIIHFGCLKVVAYSPFCKMSTHYLFTIIHFSSVRVVYSPFLKMSLFGCSCINTLFFKSVFIVCLQ